MWMSLELMPLDQETAQHPSLSESSSRFVPS